MSGELHRSYELLGVKPGVSTAELKAAHRDLAKVWHPDRFGHDPRLQKKAQEKLKEINEAYDQIISGKVRSARVESEPKAAHYSTPRTSTGFSPSSWSTYEATVPASKGIAWQWIVLPLVLFGVVFLVTTRSLLQRHAAAVAETQTSGPSEPAKDTSSQAVRTLEAEAGRGRKDSPDPAETETAAVQPASTESRPVATVSVTIDATTGLLARADCPVKTRMTYVSGNEPQTYCASAHGPTTKTKEAAPKDSRIKAITKKIVTRLGSETKDNSDGWSKQ